MAPILVIEDDPSVRRTLVQLLMNCGYEVADAANGRLGLERMSQRPADVVITDLIMPEMEGIETIRRLNQDYPRAKIIAISGGGRNSADCYLQIAQKIGVKKVLTKPFAPWELLECIRMLMGGT
jgi:CheY-like chemotaxis protein